ncbi:hypothetical protein Dtox_1144 [Desulfofarcimen acetoxidans DSM 771]|jgi:hypothetical protein|uniref:Uncharacterized protein n=1 Tax=Desulfofarcimen acetoxidans (strain ATCC 49208 / DSM 771 / KCTC 5769 / VKM B-1644 / 5575) TaxID=485916 RepID=C8W4G2_DESAS|nr:hypothetical protein [Desulfofarcimen acetoxidans]ACV62030.1 hypothetical protein Dtox_1144 [Desulfofarcimen acetoxidans DSM 771]
MSCSNPCQALFNKTGDLIRIGLRNDQTVTGTLVGIFNRIIVFNAATIRVGTLIFTAEFLWVNCNEIEWFN